jgi:ribonuclease HI
MPAQVVFMKKARRSRSKWAYLVDNQSGIFTAPDGCLTVQIGTLIDHLRSDINLEGAFTIVSPQLNAHFRSELEILFPDVSFMLINEGSLSTFFDRTMAQTPVRRRANQNTLYIGADASAKTAIGTNQTYSAWAWCSDGINGSYDYGYSGEVNVNVAELEGIMQAIVSNADTAANRIHIYSDSANAVDMFNYDLVERIIPREARKHGLVGLAKETINVLNDRSVTVEWVKGHRQHRLNMIADAISRNARKKFVNGFTADEFAHDIDVTYQMFNQQSSNLN